MTDKEKRAKEQERLKKARKETNSFDGTPWTVQHNPRNRKLVIDAWPTAHKERRHAPFSIEYNADREHRKYSVTIVDKVKSNRRTTVYRTVSRMHYESLESAIDHAMKKRVELLKMVKAEGLSLAA